MRRFFAILVVLASAAAWADALPSARPEDVGLSAERLRGIQKAFQREIDAKKLPGAVVLVARKGRVAYFEAFGARDPRSAAPMTKDAIFRIYSMTKPFTSVAAMMLAEEGKLVLTDPVSRYLPAFAKMQVSLPRVDATGRLTYEVAPAKREMTIQDLLRHTSGLVYAEFTPNGSVKEAYEKAGLLGTATNLTAAEQVERLSKAPLAHDPGEVWEYSLSVDLLGRVVEAVARMRLAQFLDVRLFKPLKLTDTAFLVPKEKKDRIAEAFPTDPATGNPNKMLDVNAPPGNDMGGSGAVSTAADYLRFAQMMANGGQLEGTRYLSRTTVMLMTSDQLGKIKDNGMTPGELLLGTRGYTFGLGFSVRLQDGLTATPASSCGAAREARSSGWIPRNNSSPCS